MVRDSILHKVRTAIGRSVGQAPAPVPEVYFHQPTMTMDERIARFKGALEVLAGRVTVVASGSAARDMLASLIDGKTSVASNTPFLRECGIADLPGVRSGIVDRAELRDVCATAEFGITGADYALADTGTLVMIASAENPRLVSLLPPVHIAVMPCSRLLTSLDELLTTLPDPARLTSSMVLITGPSRTADIEQILVRGVHGPREIHVVLVDS